LHVSKLRRADYIHEVKSCKELENLLKPPEESQKEEKNAQPNAR